MRLCRTIPARYAPAPAASYIVRIQGGTFYRRHPSTRDGANPPLFPNLHFSIPAIPRGGNALSGAGQEHWAVIGSGGATVFLDILRGLHICLPPNARTFPYLASNKVKEADRGLRSPNRAIQYVGFTKNSKGNTEAQGSYLSARYESRREETDWSLSQYLRGETALNPIEGLQSRDRTFEAHLIQVTKDLRLEPLMSMPANNLSNGQRRRAGIAKALLGRPELLLLDEPFMGLDPPTLVSLSPILRELAYKSSPRLLMSLRPQDPIPDWITHLAILGSSNSLALAGPKDDVLFATCRWAGANRDREGGTAGQMARRMTEKYGEPPVGIGQLLLAKGVDEWRTYFAVLSSNSPKYIQSSGEMVPEHLDQIDQRLWREASETPREEATLEELLALTCMLPRKYKKLDKESSFLGEQWSNEQIEDNKDQSMTANGVRSSSADDLIEMNNVVVSYGSKTVLGQGIQSGASASGINLTIRRGTRLALIGANGSGKTTLLSLITSDHPQSYALPIKFFGRSRLPSRGQPGLSLWEVQSRIGHSSPEIHAHFPKQFTIRRTLETAWAETFGAKPKLSTKRARLVDAFLEWWEPELNPSYQALVAEKVCRYRIDAWILASYPPFNVSMPTGWASSSEHVFGTLCFQSQRLLLFLRAIIKGPDLVVLDEAFSGLNPAVRDKALIFLEAGQKLVPHRQVLSMKDQHVENNSSSFSEQAMTNRRADVEKLCHKAGITVADLYDDSAPAVPKATGAKDHLRSLNTDELSAMIADDTGSRIGYEFTGLTQDQALVVVSHVREEIPASVNEYLRLPGEDEARKSKRGAEQGRCDDGSIRTVAGWNKMWGLGT